MNEVNKNTVSEEDVAAAFAILGEIKKGNESEALDNAAPPASGDAKREAEANAAPPTKGGGEGLAKENLAKAEDSEEDEDDDMKKSMDAMKGEMSEMRKSMDALCKMVDVIAANGGQTTVLAKSFADQESKMDQVARSIGVVMKSQSEQLEDIQKSHDALTERLSNVEGQPVPRKSVQNTSFLEKSFKDNDISKGEDDGMTVISGRSQVVNYLNTLSGIEKGGGAYNEFYANAVLGYEANNQLSKAVEDDLRINHKVIVR